MKNNNLSFTLLCLVVIAGVVAAFVSPADHSPSNVQTAATAVPHAVGASE